MSDETKLPGGWNYKHFLGGQINENRLKQGILRDPFAGETPTIGKDYRAYQRHWETTMHEALGRSAILKITISCVTLDFLGKLITLPGPKKTHIGSSFVFCCKHVLGQDPSNPDGVYFFPLERGGSAGYNVCPSCFRAIEKHRYNFDLEIQPHCALCVSEKLSEIQASHPDRLISLRYKD